MREVLLLADEATTYFGVACHKGSVGFTSFEGQDVEASAFVLQVCKKSWGLIEPYSHNVRPRLGGGDRIINCRRRAVLTPCTLRRSSTGRIWQKIWGI